MESEALRVSVLGCALLLMACAAAGASVARDVTRDDARRWYHGRFDISRLYGGKQ